MKELKELLSNNTVDFSHCVEKADLESLWQRFEHFVQLPIAQLRNEVAAAGGPSGQSGAFLLTSAACARFLLARQAKADQHASPSGQSAAPGASRGAAAPPSSGTPSSTGTPPPPQTPPPPAPPASRGFRSAAEVARGGSGKITADTCKAAGLGQSGNESCTRESDACKEVSRILSLRKNPYGNPATWGFKVLGITARDQTSVQRGFRNLMRILHPDKAGSVQGVADAAELVREAKAACERCVSNEQPPGMPRDLHADWLSGDHGNRKFRVRWAPPPALDPAPVRKYLVQVLDPAYGRFLTVATLEPDYSEELGRYISMEEITTYVLSEEDLQKMPKLWTQFEARVQVAAANQAGQSPFAVVNVQLAVPRNRPAATKSQLRVAQPLPQSPTKLGVPPTQKDLSSDLEGNANFEQEMKRFHQSGHLRSWLECQKVNVLKSWLKAKRWPATGTKEDIVTRVLYLVE